MGFSRFHHLPVHVKIYQPTRMDLHSLKQVPAVAFHTVNVTT